MELDDLTQQPDRFLPSYQFRTHYFPVVDRGGSRWTIEVVVVVLFHREQVTHSGGIPLFGTFESQR